MCENFQFDINFRLEMGQTSGFDVANLFVWFVHDVRIRTRREAAEGLGFCMLAHFIFEHVSVTPWGLRPPLPNRPQPSGDRTSVSSIL